jgi:hypothetical protein
MLEEGWIVADGASSRSLVVWFIWCYGEISGNINRQSKKKSKAKKGDSYLPHHEDLDGKSKCIGISGTKLPVIWSTFESVLSINIAMRKKNISRKRLNYNISLSYCYASGSKFTQPSCEESQIA